MEAILKCFPQILNFGKNDKKLFRASTSSASAAIKNPQSYIKNPFYFFTNLTVPN